MGFFFKTLVIAIAITFTCLSGNSVAQRIYTHNITIKDGLPSNKVYDIFKDTRGYVWFGTEAGLCRFDGVNYKTFTKSDGLAGNRIWSIAEDSTGNLWFACYGSGISMFDGSKFKNFYVKDGLVNENVRKIEFSKKHKGLLIGTTNGFSFYKDSVFISFKDTVSRNISYLQVTSFIETDSLIYLLTFFSNKYFLEFNPRKNTFNYLDRNHRFNNSSGTSTIGFISSYKDTIIGNGVVGIKIFSKDNVIENNNVGQVFDIVEDNSGSLWMASWSDGLSPERRRGGVYYFKDKKVEYYSYKLGIDTQECWCLLHDEEENVLWIGTLNKGIYKLPLTGIEFFSAADLNVSKPSINDYFIDSKGNSWISVGDKILINGKENVKLQYQSFLETYIAFVKSFFSFLLDKEGSPEKYKKLKEKGVTKYNPYIYRDSIKPKGSLYNPEEFNMFISRRVVDFYRFFEDTKGNVWIGSNLGVFKYNDNQGLLLNNVTIGNANILSITSDFIYLLAHYQIRSYSLVDYNNVNWIDVRKNPTWSSNLEYIKDKDCFWIYCNTDGLFKYCNNELTKFPCLSNQIDLEFNTLCKDSTGRLIAGTNTGKIYILEQVNDSLKVSYSITEKDGVIGTEISWALIDLNNRLWFGTNSGLNMLNLEKLYRENKVELSYYNQENGYFDNSTYKAVMDKSGKIVTISKDNIITINPDILVQNNKKPSLVVDRIDVNFKEIDWAKFYDTDKWTGLPVGEISLPHNSNTLTFYFHLFEYLEPHKARYSYKLEGVQSDWSPYTSETKIVLTNLSPDNYKLVIHGKLLSNPNEISELVINFTIRPPWWKAWWFYSIVVLLVILLTYQIFKNRLKRVSEKSRIDKRVSELKLEALRAQMNPHFIFNAFTSIQLYILQKDTKNALDYMGRFAKLIRMTLDNSSKKRIQLTEEISFLENYLYLEQRRVSNLNYEFILALDIDTDEVFIPPMLIQPLIENSIMHGIRHLEGEGRISIEFKKEDEKTIRCIIEDNGIGRTKSSELYSSQTKTHESRGTRITEERIRLLNSSNSNANIQLFYTDLCENGRATGTRVELLMPIQ